MLHQIQVNLLLHQSMYTLNKNNNIDLFIIIFLYITKLLTLIRLDCFNGALIISLKSSKSVRTHLSLIFLTYIIVFIYFK